MLNGLKIILQVINFRYTSYMIAYKTLALSVFGNSIFKSALWEYCALIGSISVAINYVIPCLQLYFCSIDPVFSFIR